MIENISHYSHLNNFLWIGSKPPPVEEYSLGEAADVLNMMLLGESR
jgi:hypothetical protein